MCWSNRKKIGNSAVAVSALMVLGINFLERGAERPFPKNLYLSLGGSNLSESNLSESANEM
jgi:hypothetical protein